MPFALLIIGAVLLMVGVRDRQDDFYNLVRSDFDPSDPHSFTRWAFAILVIGAVGYVPTLRPLSRAFLVLVCVVLILSNGGLFDRFNKEFFGDSQLTPVKSH